MLPCTSCTRKVTILSASGETWMPCCFIARLNMTIAVLVKCLRSVFAVLPLFWRMIASVSVLYAFIGAAVCAPRKCDTAVGSTLKVFGLVCMVPSQATSRSKTAGVFKVVCIKDLSRELGLALNAE